MSRSRARTAHRAKPRRSENGPAIVVAAVILAGAGLAGLVVLRGGAPPAQTGAPSAGQEQVGEVAQAGAAKASASSSGLPPLRKRKPVELWEDLPAEEQADLADEIAGLVEAYARNDGIDLDHVPAVAREVHEAMAKRRLLIDRAGSIYAARLIYSELKPSSEFEHQQHMQEFLAYLERNPSALKLMQSPVLDPSRAESAVRRWLSVRARR